MKPPKVSVIVPVYNVEKYIERCARSLFEQTLDDIEYIFVNDKTPDHSFEVLDRVLMDYPHRRPQVKIIEMPVNSKQAAARTAGMKAVTGEYQIHCDPDDWVDSAYYERLYNEAVNKLCDIVTADYVIHASNGSASTVHRPDVTRHSTNNLGVMFSNDFYFFSLWGHLVATRLIEANNLSFFDGVNFSEDFGFLARVFYYAKTLGHVHDVYYHYEKGNENSITRQMASPDVVAQRKRCLDLIDEFYENHGIDRSSLGIVMRSKRDIKDLYLAKETLHLWRDTYPEVAEWEYAHSNASRRYRLAYLLSHKVGVWPMRLLLCRKDKDKLPVRLLR